MKRVKAVALAAGIAAVALFAFAGTAAAYDFEKSIPDEYRINGWALGCQAYSFNRFTLFEAIERTREAGARLIELYPGQRMSTDNPKPFDHNATPEMIAAVKQKLEQEGIKPVAYGVVGLGNDETANRKVFDFAKTMGILVINSEPEEGALPAIAKMAKEYDIPVGLHNHPTPSRYWDPKHVEEVVEQLPDDLDEYIGACADTGHWMRSEVKPLEALGLLEGQIVSMHIKDLNKFGRPDEHDVPFGTGAVEMTKVLDALRDMGFKGPMSIEYEYDWEGSVPEIAQSIGFVRGYGAVKGAE